MDSFDIVFFQIFGVNVEKIKRQIVQKVCTLGAKGKVVCKI